MGDVLTVVAPSKRTFPSNGLQNCTAEHKLCRENCTTNSALLTVQNGTYLKIVLNVYKKILANFFKYVFSFFVHSEN